MHDYEIKLLKALEMGKTLDLGALEEKTGLGKDSLLWAIGNMSAANAVKVEKESAKRVELSDEGNRNLSGFPEEALVGEIKRKGKVKISDIKDQVGLSWAKRNNWIKIEKGMVLLTEEGSEIANGREYHARELLKKLGAAKGGGATKLIDQNKEQSAMLAKRGLIAIKEHAEVKSISITDEGAKMLSSAAKETGIGVLTREAIVTRAWEKQGFRTYNISAPGEAAYPARLHPLREFINVIRQKWFEMGFIEVSGPIIETAFWNFDALFSPQDHPTREMQDTFFLSNPEELTIEDIETLQKVRKMHIKGWKEAWNEEIASEAVLRTHTTSVSARYMRKLALTLNANYPLKLFSVGSVFRNENLDYKHLAELHQADGIVVGDSLTLSNLIDTLKKFYSKLGIDNMQIRPSYFPFTEPSLEAFYYDEEHGDNIELAGGGIIRKEITKAMGSDKTVLAWGLGIDRMLLNAKILGLDSIVTPYKNNVGWLRSRQNLKV